MEQLLIEMVKAIVDKPDEVNVNVNESDSTCIFELSVGDGDLGKVIGKKGKNVNALRIILSAALLKKVAKEQYLK